MISSTAAILINGAVWFPVGTPLPSPLWNAWMFWEDRIVREFPSPPSFNQEARVQWTQVGSRRLPPLPSKQPYRARGPLTF